MAKIDAGKYGYIQSANQTTLNAARTTGYTVANQPASANTKVSEFFRDSGKGGTVYKVVRFFCAFDTSSYSSGYTISSLTFNWRNTGSTTCTPSICFPTFIFVKSTAQGSADTDLATSDYYSSVTYGTAYSSNFNISTSAGDASVSLNSTAVTDFASGLLKVVMVQYGNDYSDTTSTSNMQQRAQANFSSGSSGYVPYIQFDAVATGWENDISGVVNSNIEKVDAVPVANIENIIGVE